MDPRTGKVHTRASDRLAILLEAWAGSPLNAIAEADEISAYRRYASRSQGSRGCQGGPCSNI